MAGLVCSLWV
jgi:hypothetical protein